LIYGVFEEQSPIVYTALLFRILNEISNQSEL
jgi:hypothetical protein